MINIKFRRNAGGATGFNNEPNPGETKNRTKFNNTVLTQGARHLAQNLLQRCNIKFSFLKRRKANNNQGEQENRRNNNRVEQGNIRFCNTRLLQKQPKVIDQPQRRHVHFIPPASSSEVQEEKKESRSPPPPFSEAMRSQKANHQVAQIGPTDEKESTIQPPSFSGNVKNIRELMNTEKQALQRQGIDTDKLTLKFIQETQQVHTEALLLKLLKKAATPDHPKASPPKTSDVIALAKNIRFIKQQKEAAETLDRISEKFKSHSNLKNINIELELNELQKSKGDKFKENPPLDDMTLAEVRAAAIQSALTSRRIDKDDTGLKNSIIVDSDGNLIILKNSVATQDDDFENQILRDKMADMLLKNVDIDKKVYLSGKRTHKHPEKGGYIKGILGQGGYGKARLGENMLTGELLAVKKITYIKSAENEFHEKQKLIESLKDNPSDIDSFLTANTIGRTRGKNGEIKAYLTSQLQDGDGNDAIKALYGLRDSRDENDYRKAHGELMIDTMTTLEVLDRNGIVHNDLKWPNLIGGKIADLDGLSYNKNDMIKTATPRYFPPEISKIGVKHPSQESYEKHTSFILGRMLLESVDREIDETFPLKVDAKSGLLKKGYSKRSRIPKKNNMGKEFTPYERDVIRLAFSLADTKPDNRPSVTDAKKTMNNIINKHAASNV